MKLLNLSMVTSNEENNSSIGILVNPEQIIKFRFEKEGTFMDTIDGQQIRIQECFSEIVSKIGCV